MAFAVSEKEKKILILVVLFVAVIVVAPLLAEDYLSDRLKLENNRRDQLGSTITGLQNSLNNIEAERRLVAENRENYLRWVESGVVDEPDLVRLVKTMKSIQQERKFFPIKYQLLNHRFIGPDASYLTEGSSIDIRITQVNMNMDMLHDMDAFMFIDSLTSGSLNVFIFPVECRFARLVSDFSLTYQPNLKGDCKMDWISARDPERSLGEEESDGESDEESNEEGDGQQ